MGLICSAAGIPLRPDPASDIFAFFAILEMFAALGRGLGADERIYQYRPSPAHCDTDLHPLAMKYSVLTTACCASFLFAPVRSSPAQQPATETDPVTTLKAEVERLKGMVPDQSHAMKDVAYHFSNLWFAGTNKNWPLAEFYLAETRSHLRWAVRIIPVRKTPQGQDLHLADLLDPMDKSVLTELQGTIAAKNLEGFRTKYEQTLHSCEACHAAAGKPFLRLQIPKQPEVPIIRFEPEP